MVQGRARWVWVIIVSVICAISLLVVGALTFRGLDRPPSWRSYVGWIDQAVTANDVSRAVLLWRDGYGAALSARDWESMLAIGDASMRISQIAGARVGFLAKARAAYRVALFRARRQQSLDGVLRVTDAFAALGDRDGVAQGVRMAHELAGREPDEQARVQAYEARWAASGLLVESSPALAQ